MSMQLVQLILHSKNPKLLGSFFSELLDSPLIEGDSGLRLENDKQYPFLFTKKAKGSRKPSDEYFLYLENQEELDELEQKVSFFCYRHGVKESLFRVIKNNGTLELLDLDGRKWGFSIKQ